MTTVEANGVTLGVEHFGEASAPLKAGEAGERIRLAAEAMYQALIETAARSESRRVSPSMSGQRSNDRSERVSRVGAEDEVGVADLLPSPLDLLGCCRGVVGKDG